MHDKEKLLQRGADVGVITPKEMNDLMVKLEEFYAERPKEFNIFRLAALIIRRLKSDRDFFLSFEGHRGTGKSNALLILMLVMCRYAGTWRNTLTGEVKKILPRQHPLPDYWEQIKCDFSMDNNLSFLDDADELKHKFNSLNRYMPFGIDEGSKNLHKYNWHDKLQQSLVQLSDSVEKDAIIEYYHNDEFKKDTIETMYDKYGDNPKNIKVYTIDDNFKTLLKPLKHIMKKPLRKKMFEVTTVLGKKTIVTEDHSLFILKDNKLVATPTAQITKNDFIFLPWRKPVLTKKNIVEYIDDEIAVDYLSWANNREHGELGFVKNDTFCAKVQSVKEVDYKGHVYDFEVQDIHRFVANGILHENTERYQNKGFFICIPNFKELTTAFRNDRIGMRIFLVIRHTNEDFAQAVISAKDESRWTDDPWHIDENKKKFEWLLRKVPVAQRNWKHMLRAERKLTGYLTTLAFPNLKTMAPKIWDEYYKRKIDNAQKEIKPVDKKESKQLQRYKFAIKQMIAYLKAHHKLSWTDLGKLTKLSGTSVNRIWTENTDIESEYRIIDGAKNFKK